MKTTDAADSEIQSNSVEFLTQKTIETRALKQKEMKMFKKKSTIGA